MFLNILLNFFSFVWRTLSNEVGTVTVDEAWVHQFDTVLKLTYQQESTLVQQHIQPGMIHQGVRAAIDHHERLGLVIANDVISRHGQTKLLNPPHSKRATTLQTSDGAVLLDNIDQLRMLIQPQNQYMMTLASALARRADLHVITAATGLATVATVGTSGTITQSTQALTTAHQIGGATAIDLDRIIEANELLSKAGVPSGAGMRLMLYSPGQLRDILAITQASSSDFTKNQIHDIGTINTLTWQGFTWIEIADVINEDLTVAGRMLALSGTTRSCIAMHRGAVGLSIGEEIKRHINERADLNNSIQVRAEMTMSAVRVWEGGVVQVDALEN